MKQYRFLTILLIALVMLAALPAAAQEETGPAPVGLRPDAPTYALHGPYWVGVIHFDAETPSHPTTVTIWYPALNPNNANEEVTYSDYDSGVGRVVPWGGHALKDAAPNMTDGPYPLVIFAHGFYMARFNSAFLTEHLASQGFVVMAVDYADSGTVVEAFDGLLSAYTRPMDVTWQIDYAENLTNAEGMFQRMIDTERIGVIGHSYGAYTALMAGGARLDLNDPTSSCNLYSDLSLLVDPRPLHERCEDLATKLVDLAGLEGIPEGLWPSWGDARVDAIVPLAPDMLHFGAESVSEISVPTMVVVGSNDVWVRSDLPLYKPYLYDNLGSVTKSMVVVENADHMIFNDSCEAAAYLVEAGMPWVCSDAVWDMARAHDLIDHFTTAFLLDVLKDDPDAHTALMAENVAFPGITYETTMK